MKLASFNFQGVDSIGLEYDADHLVELSSLLTAAYGAEYPAPTDMQALLASGDEGMAQLQHACNQCKDQPAKFKLIPTRQVIWLPPVTCPGKICGVAMNNSASNVRKISAPDHPAFFLKPSSCLIGHQATLKIRSYYGSVHPEPELAAIIGKTLRDVDAADALNYVAGYSIFNDITGNGMRAEDLFRYWAIYAKEDDSAETERREQHLSYAGRYKGTDGFGILGPWLVTRDEVSNPDDLNVFCSVGDDLIAQDSTRHYNYKVAEILSFISQFHTLNPGDVVSCGTAFKPSANRKSIHHANLQRVAGPVSVTIEGLGTQQNPVEVERREIGQWRLS